MALDKPELRRRIDQALGRAAADLVIKGARILNVATGTLDAGDIAICGDWIVGTHDDYRGVREIDAARADRSAGLHRHPRPRREQPGRARGVRAQRAAARHHDRDLRPARDRERPRARRHPLFPRGRPDAAHDAEGAAQLLRAGDRARDLGRKARRGRSGRGARPSGGPRPRRDDEFSGRAGQGRGRARQARRVRRLARRRPCAPGPRLPAERLSRGRDPHRPREHELRGGRGEAQEGHAGPGARGQHRQGRRGARTPARRSDLAVVRVLHRRPQSARDRRGRPHRPCDPHGDPRRRAAACRLPGRELRRRARVPAVRSRPDRRRPARRPRAARRSRELQRLRA